MSVEAGDGFELAVAPTEAEDFREGLYRLARGLTAGNITVLMTTEVTESFGELSLSFHNISFLTDNIVLLRYVEVESALILALTVMKMRSSEHSRELREFVITEKGIVVGSPFENYHGVLSGQPAPSAPIALLTLPLNDEERAVMEALLAHGESTAAEVALAAKLDETVVKGIMQNLSRRRYVAGITEADRTTYHAVMPELRGPRLRQRRPRAGPAGAYPEAPEDEL